MKGKFSSSHLEGLRVAMEFTRSQVENFPFVANAQIALGQKFSFQLERFCQHLLLGSISLSAPFHLPNYTNVATSLKNLHRFFD